MQGLLDGDMGNIAIPDQIHTVMAIEETLESIPQTLIDTTTDVE